MVLCIPQASQHERRKYPRGVPVGKYMHPLATLNMWYPNSSTNVLSELARKANSPNVGLTRCAESDTQSGPKQFVF